MKKIILFSVFLLAIGFSTSCWSQNIVYPWRATTAIVKSGQTFEVWFNAASGQTVSSIQLNGPYNTVNTTMSTIDGDWTFDPVSGNKYNKKITVTVPANAPADRYDLVLNTNSGAVTSYGGVRVIKEFKNEYYVFHISDGHLYQNGYDSDVILQRKSLIVDMSNIMDTEILIETGDNMYNVINHPEREVEYFIGKSSIGTKGMAKANAATFAVPGDHEGLRGSDFTQGTDQENADFVNDYWGLQNSSFTYGNGRYMMLNNAWGLSATSNKAFQYQVDDAISWLNGSGSGGNFLLTAGHVYDRMHHFINIVKPLSLCLSGDRHASGNGNPWEITPGGPRISYTCNDLRGGMKFIIYKVNNTTGAWTVPAGGTGLLVPISSGDVNVPATWVPNLTQTFSATNNGTATSNIATIDNKLNFEITGAKVRFVVPKGNQYAVTNGTITQEFDGTTFHIVDVATNINVGSTKQVYITAGAPVDLCPDDPNKTEPGNCGCGVPEGTCTITITGLTVNPTIAKLHLNVTKQIIASITPANATNKMITWASADETVATVSTTGLVTAVSGGTATITATTQDGGKTANSIITVIPNNLVYQAEDAEFSGPVIATNQPDYNGTGFLDYANLSNDFIKWTVYAPTTGTYNLSFRYAASVIRPLKLTINGVDVMTSVPFPSTGSFAVWGNYTTSQPLTAGNNTITLTAIGSSGGNFDELTITNTLGVNDLKANQEGKSVSISPNPVTNGIISIDLQGFENDKNIKVKIINAVGQTVYETVLTDTTHAELNLSGKLTESIYFVSVESGQTKIVNKLIVK
jgi:hypothetical protein